MKSKILNSFISKDESKIVYDALEVIKTILLSKTISESTKEHEIRINHEFIHEIIEYAIVNPEVRNPTIDWEKFKINYYKSIYLEEIISAFQLVQNLLYAEKKNLDFCNFNLAKDDYNYTLLKAKEYSSTKFSKKAFILKKIITENVK